MAPSASEFKPEDVPDNLDQVRAALRERLRPKEDVRALQEAIFEILSPLAKRLPSKEELAWILAHGLIGDVFFYGTKQLDRTIENRPIELTAALDASQFDDFRSLAKMVSSTRKRRAKVRSEEERKIRAEISKRRHDRRRHYLGSGTGWIERDFSPPSDDSVAFWTIPGDRPGAAPTCVDELLTGGEVRMAGGSCSLQDLFGRGRKSLPPSLPNIRRGRLVFYDYQALTACMTALLSLKPPAHCWLPDPGRRRTVLTDLLTRAADIATPEIRAAIESTLRPYIR